MYSTYFQLFFVFYLLYSCSGSSPKEVYAWVDNPKNGLHQSKSNQDFDLSIKYYPYELHVANELKDISNTRKIEEIEKDFKNLEYYTLRINSKKSNGLLNIASLSEEMKANVLNYYVNDFENDILLIKGKDTLSPLLYHFENTYGALSYNDISIAFEANKKIADRKIIILDKVLGLGLVEFDFKESAIQKIPTIKYN